MCIHIYIHVTIFLNCRANLVEGTVYPCGDPILALPHFISQLVSTPQGLILRGSAFKSQEAALQCASPSRTQARHGANVDTHLED